MAKALRTIAIVAGAVALIATGIGAIGGATFAATALGGTIASIATWAGVVAGVAGIGANLLTKPPPARGSVTETIVEVNAPSPYGMGEGYFAGIMRHRVGYGPTLKKVPNPYLFEALALCVAGPIEGPIAPQIDFGPVTSYYSGWLATDTRLGQRPDTALVPQLFGPATGWGGASHLSSIAAIGWNHKFDKDGKVYASGLPTRGVVAKWVKVYDPRKDSTRPGGSGSHRLGIETTYEWSESPALHAGTYAFGRYVNGKRVIGVGIPEEGIDWEGIAAWANDCQANGWRMYGFVFEGAADDAKRRWQNLRDICIAGGGEPLFAGAVVGFHWQRPRVALDTVTEADLADGPQEVTAMQSWRDRLNTVRPQYTSPLHNWTLVSADQVQVASYLTEDGEERAEEIPFNFVKDVNQAAQLGAYWLTNSRELTPITLTLMPRLRAYRPGECLHLALPELGLDHDAVILRRQFDPATMTVTLTLVTEDPAKHAFALGRTGAAPPTPSLTNSAADRDTITREARAPYWPEVDGPGRPEDGANLTAPANANRVPFSRMEGRRGWATGGDVVTPPPVPVTFDGRFYIVSQPIPFTAANQSVFLFNAPRIPVIPGERLSVSSFVQAFPVSGPNPSFWQLYFEYYNASGSIISNTQIGTGITGVSEASGRFSGFATVPANARTAQLVVQAISSAAGSMQLGLLEPMVASAAAGQTVHPPYTPGPNGEDGATLGAPAGTPVAGVPAETLVAQAAAAASDATAANGSAFAANLAIANITSDNILSRDEKPEIRKQRDEIINERPTIRARAISYGVAVGNYDADYTALIAYLAGLDLSGATDTAITRTTFNTFFTDYYADRQIVLDGIAAAASNANITIGADGKMNGAGTADIVVDNSKVPTGNNAVVNSDFTRGKFGWAWRGGGFEADWGVNLTGTPNWFGQRNVMWATVPGPSAFAGGSSADLSPNALWGGASIANAPLFAMPVVQGDRLAATVLAAPHRCTFQLFILFFDGAGTFIPGPPAVVGGTLGGAANGDPANFGQITVIGDAPANARWAIPMMRMNGNGGVAPFIFFTEPMLSKVAPGQTTAPRYAPGRADSLGQPNTDINISGGNLLGIGPGNGTPVDNTRNLLRDTLTNLPATGVFVGQQFSAINTGDVLRWSGSAWVSVADITGTINGPADITLNYASDLTLSSPLPVTGTYQLVLAGGGAVSSGVSWAVTVISGSFTSTAPTMVGTGSGQLRINSAMTSPEAQLRITATVGGKTYPGFTVKVSRSVAAPSNSGGGSGSSAPATGALTTINSSSFTRMHASDLTVTLGSGVTSVALVASGDLVIDPVTPTGSTIVEGKWQRESSPGTWADVGSTATSSPLPNVYDAGLLDGLGNPVYAADPGSISCNASATGLSGGSTQKFRFMARVSGGNVRNVTGSGNVSATA